MAIFVPTSKLIAVGRDNEPLTLKGGNDCLLLVEAAITVKEKEIS